MITRVITWFVIVIAGRVSSAVNGWMAVATEIREWINKWHDEREQFQCKLLLVIDQKGATNLYIGTTYLLIHYYDNNRISHQLLHLSKRRATSGNGEGEYVRGMDRQENYRTNIGERRWRRSRGRWRRRSNLYDVWVGVTGYLQSIVVETIYNRL